MVEGVVAEDGRSSSIGDIATHLGRMSYKGNGDVAADKYHKFKLTPNYHLLHPSPCCSTTMKPIGRLLPGGREINPKGLQYYDDLINNYLRDHQKVKATRTLFQMVAADWLRSDKREDDFGGHPGRIVQKYAK
ncbi:hypothetical protein H6P81_016392 [Aristolochia fimbriata]|uniref:Uncharacterized protein n=1 Tax=Aristolochia fimbriata TaxID=158543 RepID=A0AAV7EBD9_ARIFI|nr:hypothetical protein H6P81_016392 [Aristolochia fimbriata]